MWTGSIEAIYKIMSAYLDISSEGQKNVRNGDSAEDTEKHVDEMILAEDNSDQEIANDRLPNFSSGQTTTSQTDNKDQGIRDENDTEETTIKTEDLVTKVSKPSVVGLLGKGVLQVAFPCFSLLKLARGQLRN